MLCQVSNMKFCQDSFKYIKLNIIDFFFIFVALLLGSMYTVHCAE